jgi:surface polysaccharide O-acyltransferase-like enzyme
VIGTYFLHGFASCAVPIFMIVSGYITFGKQTNAQLIFRRLVAIFIFFLFWSTVTVYAHMLIVGPRLSFADIARTTFFREQGVNNHLWFFLALIAVNILVPAFSAARSYGDGSAFNWTLLAVNGLVFGQWVLELILSVYKLSVDKQMPAGDTFQPFDYQGMDPFGGHVFAVAYFMVGGFIRKYHERFAQISSLVYAIIIFLSLMTLCLYGMLRTC